jgi:hypothetical protein
MKTVALENFGQGMTADIRDQSVGRVKLIKHFDILTRPHTLTPYHSQINGDSNSANNQMTDFVQWQSRIYGIGQWSAGKLLINYQDTFTSSSWLNTANNAGNHIAVPGCFVSYHNLLYGVYDSGKVWKYDPTGAGLTEDSIPGPINSIPTAAPNYDQPNGIVHSKDDILYLAIGNIVASNNNGSWTNPALTLPSGYIITAMCEYGNYLAIACTTTNNGVMPTGRSVVYLWDRDSTLNTISEVIDFGFGVIRVLDQIEGELIAVSLREDVFSNLASRFIFRKYAGNQAVTFQELIASSTTGLMLGRGQRYNNNRLYFMAGIEIDGTLHNGIWGIGKDPSGHWIVWFDRLPNNDTAIAAGSLTGFYVMGDFMYISYNDGGYNLTMTSSTSTAYAGSSIIETVINPNMPVLDHTANKQLETIAVSYDPIPSGGQVVIKWKVDGGSWNTARTETTVGRVVSEIPSAEANFTSGREYQFRIESTGGVMLTGMKYKYEPLTTLI